MPKIIVGKKLVPLKMLDDFPEIQREYLLKYKGRRHILSQKVPPLNCLSSQVLNFTAVHPKKTDIALKEAGFTKGLLRRKWFKIDPRILDPDQTTVFLYKEGIPPEDEKNFTEFRIDDLRKYNAIGNKTRSYYREKFSQGVRPLLFHLIPHILYRGRLNISDLEVIEI
jgi:hypothetical protein